MTLGVNFTFRFNCLSC